MSHDWERQLRRNIDTAARAKTRRAVFVLPEIRRKVGEGVWQKLREYAARRKVALVECCN